MKKNLILVGILMALLLVTWLVTEKDVLKDAPAIERELVTALENVQRISLPAAELARDQKGVWRNGDGEVVRAEYLNELHKNLSQIKASKSIPARTIPPGSNPYFSKPYRIGLDQFELILGDLTPTGDAFYFSAKGHADIYLADLQDMSSVAVADTDNQLQREKYHRFLDLVTLPGERWRENRLGALTRFGSFRSWRAGELSLNVAELKTKPWAEAILTAFQQGIAGLQVQGNVQPERPATHAKLDDWHFVLEDGSAASWEFYNHPSLELIYVWIPRLNKAYPLNQESSDLLKVFLPRLITRATPLTLHPAPESEATLTEGTQTWYKKDAVFGPSGIDDAKAKSLLNFFQTRQTFDHLSLLGKKDCQRLLDGSRFKVSLASDTFGLLPVKGGYVVLECQTGMALGWEQPANSDLNFTTLRKAP